MLNTTLVAIGILLCVIAFGCVMIKVCSDHCSQNRDNISPKNPGPLFPIKSSGATLVKICVRKNLILTELRLQLEMNETEFEQFTKTDIPITNDIAEKLQQFTQISAQFWLNMQQNYDETKNHDFFQLNKAVEGKASYGELLELVKALIEDGHKEADIFNRLHYLWYDISDEYDDELGDLIYDYENYK